MITRREVVVGGSLTILSSVAGPCLCAAHSIAPHSRGCLLAESDFEAVYPATAQVNTYLTGCEKIIAKSGDANFDLALAQTLTKIADYFEVLPGFAYYDDSDSENAYATPRVRLKNSDGTVLFGLNFFQRLRRLPDSPEVAIAGVCSHEFGHIVQFKNGLIETVNRGQPTVKRCELQADYFAGYFAGLRKRENPSYPAAVVALAQHDVGDTAFTNPNHHGTPEERGAAVVRGFEAAFREHKGLREAIEQSTSYVMLL